MMSVIKEFIRLFGSPEEPDPNDHEAVRAHKKAIIAWRNWMGWSQIAMWFFFWWALGLGSILGLEIAGKGFAKADDVIDLKQESLERKIMEDWIRYCLAETQDGQDFFWKTVQISQSQYYDMLGYRYEVPECKDLKGL